MIPRFKISSVISAIAFSLTCATSALAQTSIQSLPNGNYRFCTNPPPKAIVDDIDVRSGSHCFLFRKLGDRVTGYLWDMSTSGEVRACTVGTVNGNVITGEAYEYFFDTEITPEPKYQGTTPQNWDDYGYLKVAGATARYTHGVVTETTIKYSTAILNISDFYRYNAGTQSPPTSCRN